ncbi:MAG: TetR family transcriptional regulator [Dehalococcoidia bacterium]|nr:TetR family transcriptional regulator [Dehalococcoidia bacterium]
MPRAKGREPLTLVRIVDAALALVDERGLDALTMRRLGGVLGVDPMAVYYHVADKRTLLGHLVDAVFADLDPPAGIEDWREQVRAWARAYRDLALAHPNLVLQLFSYREAVAAAAARADPPLRAAVGASGLPPADVEAAGDLVVDYVHGYVLGEASAPPAARGDGTGFEAVLDLIVTGIEARALTSSTTPRRRRAKQPAR